MATRSTSIAQLTNEVSEQWSDIQKLNNDLAAPWYEVAADELARFRLWANTLGAYHDDTDQRSAEYRLRDLTDVRERVLELLEELHEYFDDIYKILSGQRQGEVEEASGDNGDNCLSTGRSEISDLWLMVGNVRRSLMKTLIIVRMSTDHKSLDLAGQATLNGNASSTTSI